MAANRVQFQRGLSMVEFQARFGTEAQCEGALAKARWPRGFRCPKCDAAKHCVFQRERRSYWECSRCHQQVTVTAGTIFQATKLPLTSWFLAMHLLTQAKNNMSALALMRHLGVSYRTAWTVKHKLLQVMQLEEEARVLSGQVEVFQTVLGGGRRAADPARKSLGKPILVAVQKFADGAPESVRIAPAPRDAAAVQAWANATLSSDAWIQQPAPRGWTAGFRGKAELKTPGNSSSSNKGGRRVERRCASPLLGNFTAAMHGTYHAVNFHKYGDRYLAEAQYRFNRRERLGVMLVDLMASALRTRPHKEYVLRAA